MQHALHGVLRKDALGQVAAGLLQLHDGADVEREIADPLAVGEQALDGAKALVAAPGRQVGHAVGEVLDVAHGDDGERLTDTAEEIADVARS